MQLERKVQTFANEISKSSLLLRRHRRSGNQAHFYRLTLALDQLKLPNRGNFRIATIADQRPK